MHWWHTCKPPLPSGSSQRDHLVQFLPILPIPLPWRAWSTRGEQYTSMGSFLKRSGSFGRRERCWGLYEVFSSRCHFVFFYAVAHCVSAEPNKPKEIIVLKSSLLNLRPLLWVSAVTVTWSFSPTVFCFWHIKVIPSSRLLLKKIPNIETRYKVPQELVLPKKRHRHFSCPNYIIVCDFAVGPRSTFATFSRHNKTDLLRWQDEKMHSLPNFSKENTQNPPFAREKKTACCRAATFWQWTSPWF